MIPENRPEDSEKSVTLITPISDLPSSRGLSTTPSTPLSTPKASAKPTFRRGKKAQDAAEQARREAYAHELFSDLNHVVFDDKLPEDTKLNWNIRLRSTAGRAKWHR